ncbi:LPXTG-motif cell wall anchor domain-containing protein [Microbacterium sp. ru370.1]|uniref:choice-of-anchor I family protein n=1 Tax=unclassified Microbacterium TaxID=2609290 RepID=UPI0008921D2F|nr:MULTISPECIES: choice-of-anchor I family protein [unclassified Microbacterium]SDO28296.1 LPXTG-motif cell wall anchor domain-containing protein [Microbacterium sp. ru370.1]SIT75141.1 LPXTG-motif cell wall anchor domain-containing protein [Microbacterium sp. RU1D]
MPSPLLRRAVAFSATTATVCALALSSATAASAALVADPVRDVAADSPVALRPLGTYETGVFDQSAAEIVHAYKNRLFVVNAQAGAVDVLDNSNPVAPAKLYAIAGTGVANSLAVRADGLGVIALESTDKTAPGRLVFFDADAAEPTVLGEVAVGALPDMVAISDDGAFAVVANEGEPADDFTTDPEGTVGVVALPSTKTAPTQDAVRTAGFGAFEQGRSKTLDPDVRVFGPDVAAPDQGSTPLAANRVSRNLEPEYVAIAGSTAYVALQEANAVATVDLASAEVTGIRSLGFKDYGVETLDASDRDPEDAPTYSQKSYSGLFGMYMPDGIQAYQAGGETYLVTANEGDGREWGDYNDTARVKDLGDDGLAPVCDDSPLAGSLGDADLGRLNIATDMGLNADGTCYSELYTFGGRGFSVWNTAGEQVFDSGSDFEHITHHANPDFFNSNHSESNLEGRSDDKGPEPENLAIGEVDGRTYAFIGLERVGGVMTYDITDPANATYAGYVNNRDFSISVEDQLTGDQAADRELLATAGDLGPEGVEFISAADSPTGRPLVAVGNEVSGTTTVFAVENPNVKNIDILTINDFHGRLEAGTQGEAGAAVLAGAVKAKEAHNPNTLFVSAGDNIGASTFTSLIQNDSPTIDTLKATGLDVSAVGNHEFDRGFADLTERVLGEYGGGEFGLGANVYKKGTKEPALQEYAVKDVDGVRVAFIGTVTPDTATMVDPAGIAGLDFGDQLEAANRVADEITAGDLADVIVLLTHSGAATSNDCAAIAADQAGFGALAVNASPEIDAIVSAHTHQTYACDLPVAGTDRTRPVIQASEYGKAMGQLSLAWDTRTDSLASVSGTTFPLTGAFAPDADIAAKVAEYVAQSDVIGAEPIGRISGDILRGGSPSGADRGVESSMGNWVADVYLWATSENPAYAGTTAQIALMNPGGLRADLLKGDDGVVTYKEAALVQSFANTLVTVKLTGAQIRGILNEQWKATGDRPKLHLGVSDGFTYDYTQDATNPRVGSVVSMAYQGRAIAETDTFTVVTNSFLGNGGDGFATFAAGTDRTDTGQIDLDATLAYFRATGVVDPAPLGRAVLTTDAEPAPGEPSTEPTPAPAPGQPGEQPGRPSGERPGGGLANTGAEAPWGLALAGGFLVVAGGLAFALRKRRAV